MGNCAWTAAVGLACAGILGACGERPAGVPGPARVEGGVAPAAVAVAAAVPVPPPQAPAGGALERGLEVFQRQCAVCHGAKGLGDGPASFLLYPKPRNFASGTFRLTSTASGLPSDADLVETLRRGMPGSAMPAWSHLPEEDLRALVQVVRRLAVEGRTGQLLADAKKSGEDLPEAEAREIAADVMKVGAPFPVPPATPATPAVIARGRASYEKNCAACHDADGRGRQKTDLKDAEGNPTFARDFTQGLFKGGSDPQVLALRILRGIPGSPMPGNPLPPDEAWAIVHYVRTLIPAGAEVDLRQRNLTAARVPAVGDPDPAAALWAGVPPNEVPVMPLWWRHDRIPTMTVQAVHDGAKLAIRVSWPDATTNDHGLGQHAFTDAGAVMFTPSAEPPTVAMGDANTPCSLWHWKASWQRDGGAAGPPPQTAAFPNLQPGLDVELLTDEKSRELYYSGRAAGNPLSQERHGGPVEAAGAYGFGTLATRPKPDQTVRGGGTWADGRWGVVFVRDLAAPAASDIKVDFTPGATTHFALAVWDGGANDRDGQKAITIWHRLTLQR